MKLKNVTLSAFLLLLAVAPLSVAAQSGESDLESIFNYVKISDDLSSSGQIPYDQMKDVADAGFDMVINLATVNEAGNALEGFLVAEQGVTYLNIPVSWPEPAMSDLELFFDIMKVSEGRKVYVHCAANMRASVFVYLYRTLVAGEEEALAREDMEKVWDPSGSAQWAALIESAQMQFASTK